MLAILLHYINVIQALVIVEGKPSVVDTVPLVPCASSGQLLVGSEVPHLHISTHLAFNLL